MKTLNDEEIKNCTGGIIFTTTGIAAGLLVGAGYALYQDYQRFDGPASEFLQQPTQAFQSGLHAASYSACAGIAADIIVAFI